MEHANHMSHNFFLNTLLTGTTLITGFISVNFAEQLKQISLILTPFVQICSITSFVLFVIINRKNIKDKIKSLFK